MRAQWKHKILHYWNQRPAMKPQKILVLLYKFGALAQTRNMNRLYGIASVNGTHMSIQSKEEALFLTLKKLIISAQSNSCFLFVITRELFLLMSHVAWRFSCPLKSLFIFGAWCKFVRLTLGYNLPAVPTFIHNFISFCRFGIRCLPSWESFLICDKFGLLLSLSISMLSKMVFNSALSLNYFWFPLNVSYTTSLTYSFVQFAFLYLPIFFQENPWTDIAALEQFINFIQFVDHDSGEVCTDFLFVENALANSKSADA